MIPRLAATILYPGAPWDGGVFDSRPVGHLHQAGGDRPQNAQVSVTGFNIRKYIDITDKADRGNGGIDIILMRYADVLLMYAEAKVELGQSRIAAALAAFNLVRARVEHAGGDDADAGRRPPRAAQSSWRSRDCGCSTSVGGRSPSR